jgi:putative transposase
MKELIDAVVEMKRCNPTWGCKRIAQQIALAFGVEIDKDVVRRILGTHFRPEAGSGGPSWLSFIGHAKDPLWSLDLFRCESAILQTYWVLVVMDQFTRRIVGFAVHRGVRGGLRMGHYGGPIWSVRKDDIPSWKTLSRPSLAGRYHEP